MEKIKLTEEEAMEIIGNNAKQIYDILEENDINVNEVCIGNGYIKISNIISVPSNK